MLWTPSHRFCGCRVRMSAAQTLSNTTQTQITAWDTEDFDTDAFHDNATNPGRLTAPFAGYYLVVAHLVFAANATGQRKVIIRGSKEAGEQVNPANTQGTERTGVSVSGIVSLTAGQYLYVAGFQGSGGNLDVQPQDSGEGGYSSFEIALLGT